MTKRDLVVRVSEKLGYSQTEVHQIIRCALNTIIDSLKDEKRLEIRNFGVFEVKTRKARMGRNPRTGDRVPIPQKLVATFKAGKDFREILDNKATQDHVI